jgi:cation diffusion facilitator family transporter
MNSPQAPTAPTKSPEAPERSRSIQRVTLVAVLTNSLLAVGQMVIGIFANAFSLVADAVHTLSDLFTDAMVLLASRKGANPADIDHPYGHGRFETAATLILGGVLAAVGLGFLWSSGLRLQAMESAPPLHQAALWMAGVTLVAKEGLFRFTLAASRRLKAPLLEANAWHARSDAASSLVVAAGIGGSLAGYPFLEPLAAAVVGFLILHMGVRLAWRAMRELVDTGLPNEEVERIGDTIRKTAGVVGVHEIRTRRMADRVLCDTHVQVDPRITVSEGHRISDAVYFRIRDAHPEVRDVLVHIDPEDDGDLQTPPPGPPPERAEIRAAIEAILGDADRLRRIQIHYLGHRIEIEVMLAADLPSQADVDALKERTRSLLETDPRFRAITFFVQVAP